MVLKALPVNKRWEYIPISERGSENPTKFVLQVLDSRIHGIVHDKLNSMEMVRSIEEDYENLSAEDKKKVATDMLARLPMNEVAYEYVSCGLHDWVNFKAEDGESDMEIKKVDRIYGSKTYQVVSLSCMGVIPSEIVQELYQELIDKTFLSEQEVKN